MNPRRLMSPTIVVSATALFVIAASLVAGLFGLRIKDVDPRVTMEFGSGSAEQRVRGSVGRSNVVTTINGEVARTAERIGEATALALAASLYAATEQIRGRTPPSVRDLVAGLALKKLLPPGLTLTETAGTLISSHGSLAVRYRPTPLGIEVVAAGREQADGPALIVRVPDETSRQGEAKLFIANQLNDVRAPSPFAPAAEVIALGWSPERLHSPR